MSDIEEIKDLELNLMLCSLSEGTLKVIEDGDDIKASGMFKIKGGPIIVK